MFESNLDDRCKTEHGTDRTGIRWNDGDGGDHHVITHIDQYGNSQNVTHSANDTEVTYTN